MSEKKYVYNKKQLTLNSSLKQISANINQSIISIQTRSKMTINIK